MIKRLDGKTILITGAGGGIGTAMALLFAKAGGNLCLVDKREKELSEIARRCKELRVKVLDIVTDVTDKTQVEKMTQECLTTFEGIDILINAAAYGKYGPFTEVSIEDWDMMWRVCVRGMVLVMQGIVPSMIDRKSGHIVNFSSIHGIQTSANSSAYCAAKYAVTGLTEALAIELWKYGIKVSAIYPGGVLTPFMGVPPEKKPQEFLEPEEIAEVLLDVVTAPGKALIKQIVVVPKNRPFTVLEVNWTR